ncbi:NUDIX hydrolase [Alicyclobacillus sp. ALC3]|uniref:NUDIX hydrolase n=1 Tax=Alicyclobacillus sp. ALC3 TaxID=2796143 RepID=UPI0023789630|nr:8-oxo-dGTP diphosphatase [Alicyclobacillus sp. ALC3]
MGHLLRYTICFIRCGESVLMLNRNRAPNMGLWNGVGGKLEPTETPLEGVLREVREETGLHLEKADFSGIVTWNTGGSGRAGMYAFMSEVESHMQWSGVTQTREGLLEWKPSDWVLHPDNHGVPAHVSRFLTQMLRDRSCYEHKCEFEGTRLAGYTIVPLAEEFYREHRLLAVSARALR